MPSSAYYRINKQYCLLDVCKAGSEQINCESTRYLFLLCQAPLESLVKSFRSFGCHGNAALCSSYVGVGHAGKGELSSLRPLHSADETVVVTAVLGE